MFLAYIAGVAMRNLMPEIKADEAFITLLLTHFPVGVKGLLLVGLIAALLSTIDGLIASSATLLTQDIYGRFIKKNMTPGHLKGVTIILQVIVTLSVFMIVPIFMSEGEVGSIPAYQIIQEFLGDLFGVLIAIYILGIFFRRTTGYACFIAMLLGMAVSYGMKSLYWFDVIGNPINFGHRGTIQFIVVMVAGYLLSLLEKPKSDQELTNLTIWTLPDVKGPWIGLKAWPGLWKWAVGLPLTWFALTIAWELYMRG
jgi:SSS family solute:Na+ symporter